MSSRAADAPPDPAPGRSAPPPHDAEGAARRALRSLALGLIRLRARQSSELSRRPRREFATHPARPERSCKTDHDGEPHDRHHPRAPGRAEDHADARPEGAVARALRHRAAALQPPLPREPARLPHPGAGLRRAEARDAPAAGGARRAATTAATSPPAASAHDARPVAGTRLVREYQGVEHTVTVLADGYEWQGRPYRSLSAIARAITGTRWNGLVFFGLKSQRSA